MKVIKLFLIGLFVLLVGSTVVYTGCGGGGGDTSGPSPNTTTQNTVE
jgi:hypothetical protein